MSNSTDGTAPHDRADMTGSLGPSSTRPASPVLRTDVRQEPSMASSAVVHDPRPDSARPTPGEEAHAAFDNDDRLPWGQPYEERYPVKYPAKYSEFEKKYPPDKYGEEASDNARVWKMYRDGADDRDTDILDSWSRTLDILLIFTGLFSAMATAFIVEAYKELSPDYTQYMALAYISVHSNASEPIPRPADFVASKTALWTNGLWFTSLSLSLLVALLAILAKQWLAEYSSRMRAPVASQRRWVCRHRFYNIGLSKWRLDVFISVLPFGLHLALLLFFIGLVVFLSDINTAFSVFIGSGVVLTAIFYFAATVAPIWYGDCPTATPLLRHAYRLFNVVRSRFVGGVALHSSAFDEERLLTGKEERLKVEALSYIVETSPAEDEICVAVEAVGGLEPLAHQLYLGSHTSDTLQRRCRRRLNDLLYDAPRVPDPMDLGRALRSAFCAQLDFTEIDRGRIRETCALAKTHDLLFMSLWLNMDRSHVDLTSSRLKLPRSRDPLVPPSVLESTIHAVLLNSSIVGPTSDFGGNEHDLAYLYALSLPSWRMFASRRRGVRAKLKRVLDTVAERLGLHPVARETLADFAAFWQDAMTRPSLPQSQREAFRQAYLATLRVLSKEWTVSSMPDMERSLGYFGTSDLRNIDKWRIDDLEAGMMLMYEVPISDTGRWSTNLGRGFRQLLWRYALQDRSERMNLFSASYCAYKRSGHNELDFTDICRSASRIVSGGSSEANVITSTVVNLLESDPDNGVPSAWQTFCRYDPTRSLVLGSLIAAYLCALQRRGGDVASWTNALTEPLASLPFITPPLRAQFVQLAKHLKEVSQTWWEETSAGILAIPGSEWKPGPDGRYTTPQDLVGEVNRLSPCTDCIPQNPFPAFDPTLPPPNEQQSLSGSDPGLPEWYTRAVGQVLLQLAYEDDGFTRDTRRPSDLDFFVENVV